MTENSGDTPLIRPDNIRFKLTFEERVARLPDATRSRFNELTSEIGTDFPRGPVPNVEGDPDQIDVLGIVEDIVYRQALHKQGQGHTTRDGRFHTWVSDNRISPKSGEIAASIMSLSYRLSRKDLNTGDGFYLEHVFETPKAD